MEFQNIEELKKLRVVDLKERLSKLGKSTSGLKADLVDRLYNALAEKSGQVDLSAAAPSYVQMCNISSMEPEPPVVEVTIDTSQFDMSVQEPQIVTMGQYNVMDDVSQINVQHQINEQQVYYQSPDESDQLRLQQEDLWRQQQDQLLRQQQQQEAAERYQQQEFERQEMMERQELERITAAEEEAAAAAERMRVMEEQELEMNRVREVESDRERQAEAQRMIMEEEFRIQQQQREEEELMRRRYEEEQRQREFERQREVELARQRELEMEMERQRQTEELERQLQMEAERQRELERERLRELELERQREAELERQREAELARQREAELERQAREAELERQREAELERRAREAELERQREAELERQAREAELERQRQAELERQREAELERQREAEREAELERQKQAELRERQLMEMELERQREIELLRQREAERQKELELQRQKEAAEEEERQRELERQELERQELERKRVAAEKEEERLRELEREKALEKEKELERQRIAAEEEEERRKKEYQAELQKKKQEEEQMHQIYQEQLRKERDEQLKREEEFQRLQEFQKKEKELEEEELRQSLIDEARKNEVSEEKMEMDDDIQEIPRPPQDKDLIAHHSTSVITHTGNAQNFSHKISKQTSELEAINNSKNKENLDSTETSQNGKDEKTESPKEKLSKNQKRKIKKKRRQINRKEQSEKRNNMLNSEEEQNEKEKNTPSDVSVEIQYVGDEVDLKPTDPMYFHFMKIFENFKLVDPEQAKREAEEAALKAKLDAKKEPDLRKKPKDADEEPELEPKKDEQPKLSKRKLKQLTRLSIAELKQHVNRPDVVEMHDVTAKDPKLLVLLKSTRNTVPVPRHWCFKRKFLQGKRGIEKPPFNLPEFIKKTGIMEMRQALQEKEDQKTLKAKMREKVRPKMGKIDIDYQKLHDAFFKWQTKPRMTIHGDLYYEGKEYETRLKEKKPGELSDDLRTALGMPVGPGCQKIPPPWLIAMQRYGPPPSYPNLKVPGLNSPIPDGCSFGYHAGGWGKPPVDELGRPLYGDVFGTTGSEYTASMPEEEVDRSQWGELESESESEEEEGEEEEEEEGAEGEEIEMDKEGGIATPAEGGLATPSGLSSVSMGMETPDMIELRKRKIENEMDNAENPTLYQVLAEKKPDRMSGLMMGSTHVYDISSAMPPKVRTSVSHLGGDGGVDVALDPSELDMDQATMASRYEQTLREQRMGLEKEDLSDMVAEHTAKQKNKRKRATNTTGNTQPQDANRSAKKYKDFKF